MKVTIINFKYYTKRTEYVFNDASLTMIKGASGTGKSTIFEAIMWCLYGPSRGYSNSAVKIEDFASLNIVRSGSNLEVAMGDNVYSGESAQLVINEVIGDKNFYRMSCYLSQRSLNPIISSTAQERYSLIRNMTFGDAESVNNPDMYIQKLDSLMKIEKENLVKKEAELGIYTGMYNSINSKYSDSARLWCENSNIDPESEIQRLSHEVDSATELINMRNRMRDMVGKEPTYPKSPSERSMNILSHSKNIDAKTFNKMLSLGIREKYTKEWLQSAVVLSECVHALGGKLCSRDEIARIKSNMRARAERYLLSKAEVSEWEAKAREIESQYQNEMQKYKDDMKKWAQESEAARESNSYRDSLLAKYSEDSKAYSRNQAAYDDYVKKSGEFEELRDKLAPYAKWWSEHINAPLSEHNLTIESQNTTLVCPHCNAELLLAGSVLNPTEKRPDLSVALDLLRKINRLKIVKVDAPTMPVKPDVPEYIKVNPIPSEPRAYRLPPKPHLHEDVSNLSSVMETLESTPYVEGVNVGNRSKYKIILANYDEYCEFLDLAHLGVENYAVDVGNASRDVTGFEHRLETYNTSLTEYTKARDKLAEFNNANPDLDRKLNTAKSSLAFANKLNESKVAYDEIMRSYEVASAANNDVIYRMSVVSAINDIRTLVSETATMAMEKTVSDLSLLINMIAAELFDDPISISINTHKELKTKDTKKMQINASVTYNGIVYDSPAHMSGGEQDRISLAITIAVSRITGARAVLLDECMASINEEQQGRCLSAIKRYIPDKLVVNVCHSAVEGLHDAVVVLN